ncbi:conserved hypothetical protein [Candidatus Sulfopaludibacter sp. SbA3]|nr:conserved hypothetical protein [Candidatus Sulfopaludibacter sp. SbA3]
MRVLDRNRMDKEDVRQMPDAELALLGVRLLNKQDIVLQCASCRETWAPQLDSTGKLPFDYWVCPANCNR